MLYRIADANSYEVLGTFPEASYVASTLLSLGRYEVSRTVLSGVIYVFSLLSPTAQPYIIP
jgi:hypothetical protein